MRLVIDLLPSTFGFGLHAVRRALTSHRPPPLPDAEVRAALDVVDALDAAMGDEDSLDELGSPADGGDRVTYESADPATRAAIVRLASGRTWREGPPPVRVRVVIDYAPREARPTHPEDLREPRHASGEVVPLRRPGGDGGGG